MILQLNFINKHNNYVTIHSFYNFERLEGLTSLHCYATNFERLVGLTFYCYTSLNASRVLHHYVVVQFRKPHGSYIVRHVVTLINSLSHCKCSFTGFKIVLKYVYIYIFFLTWSLRTCLE